MVQIARKSALANLVSDIHSSSFLVVKRLMKVTP